MDKEKCCDKCYTTYTEKDYPEHTTYDACLNLKCDCHKNLEKEFENEMERCLNEYWYNLTPLEKQRYLEFIKQREKKAKLKGFIDGFHLTGRIATEEMAEKINKAKLELLDLCIGEIETLFVNRKLDGIDLEVVINIIRRKKDNLYAKM